MSSRPVLQPTSRSMRPCALLDPRRMRRRTLLATRVPLNRQTAAALVHAALFALAGVAIALVSWSPGQWLVALLALPYVWARASCRRNAWALWFGYYACGARDIPLMTLHFFTGYHELPTAVALFAGVVLWILSGALLALPWAALAPRRHASVLSVALRTLGAITIVTLPPLGVIGWLSPTLAAAALYPGFGAAGLVLGLVCLIVSAVLGQLARHASGLPALNPPSTSPTNCYTPLPAGPIAYLRRPLPRRHSLVGVEMLLRRSGHTARHVDRLTDRLPPLALLSVVMLLSVSTGASVARLRHPTPVVPAGWIGLDTALGRSGTSGYPSRYARTQILQQLSDAPAFADGTRVVVLPEEVVGPWTDATVWWWTPLAQRLAVRGRTLVFGADVFRSERTYTDSAIVLGAGAESSAAQTFAVRYHARIPMPVGLWRPWADWGGGVTAMRGAYVQPYASINGRRVAFSLCYEDFLIWPHLRLLIDPPDVLLDLANLWFADDLAIAQIQQQSIGAFARLAGVPVLRAVNHRQSHTELHNESQPLSSRTHPVVDQTGHTATFLSSKEPSYVQP
jgi:hypothetical protein